jgi:hypothetical protein
MNVAADQICTRESTDGGDDVASRASALFQLHDRLRPALFEREPDPQSVGERDVVTGIRPHRARVAEEQLAPDVGRVAFEQAQAVARQQVGDASELLVAALGSSFVYA